MVKWHRAVHNEVIRRCSYEPLHSLWTAFNFLRPIGIARASRSVIGVSVYVVLTVRLLELFSFQPKTLFLFYSYFNNKQEQQMNDFIPSICTTRREARDACMQRLAKLYQRASSSLAVGDNSVDVSVPPAWDKLNEALTKPKNELGKTMENAIDEYNRTFSQEGRSTTQKVIDNCISVIKKTFPDKKALTQLTPEQKYKLFMVFTPQYLALSIERANKLVEQGMMYIALDDGTINPNSPSPDASNDQTFASRWYRFESLKIEGTCYLHAMLFCGNGIINSSSSSSSNHLCHFDMVHSVLFDSDFNIVRRIELPGPLFDIMSSENENENKSEAMSTVQGIFDTERKQAIDAVTPNRSYLDGFAIQGVSEYIEKNPGMFKNEKVIDLINQRFKIENPHQSNPGSSKLSSQDKLMTIILNPKETYDNRIAWFNQIIILHVTQQETGAHSSRMSVAKKLSHLVANMLNASSSSHPQPSSSSSSSSSSPSSRDLPR